MLDYVTHRQACHDRLLRLRAEADAAHHTRQARGLRQRRRRRLTLAAGLDVLLRARRNAARHGEAG